MPKKAKKTKSDSAQSDFITLTSHQLRTPLSGMRWLLELMQKAGTGNLNKKQQDYLEKIYSLNERMIALVNDLLEVTRLEQGGAKMFFQPTDLVEIIRGLVKEMEKQVRSKRLKISFTTESEPFPTVKTEPNKIKQSLSNILQNAITYTPDGGHVTIDLKRIDGTILCTVTDSGVGIPKDQAKQVFTKFFRGSNVLKFETVGTGLGLYITKRFIEASGGRIWFKSEEGKGSTFFFTLPIMD